LILALQNALRQKEGEKQFVFFKERTTHIFVKGIGKVVVKVGESFFKDLGLNSVFHSHLEEVDVPLKGVLIHGVYGG
jgi:hypothetical protein